MAARSRGNGTNFDWLRKSCDISTCDLSPDGNPEKYGRHMKSAITIAICFGVRVLLMIRLIVYNVIVVQTSKRHLLPFLLFFNDNTAF